MTSKKEMIGFKKVILACVVVICIFSIGYKYIMTHRKPTIVLNQYQGKGVLEHQEDIELIPFHGSTYEGKLMIIKNPSDISIGINPGLLEGKTAPSIMEYVDLYHAVGAINAGGFVDEDMNGDGSKPWGIVIKDGEYVYGDLNKYMPYIAFDENQQLLCGSATGNELLEWNVKDAITFGPTLIQNYEVQPIEDTSTLKYLNPRSAIGQREDGSIILMTIDGRVPTSFGALYEDMIEEFNKQGCKYAGNLDGGNSTAMIYKGEYVNQTVSMRGSRNLPTVFLVKEGSYDE